MWVLLALGSALLLILFSARLRWPQTLGYLAGTGVLVLACAAGPSHGALALFEAAVSRSTLSFVASVFSVFVLSGQLQESGALRQLASAASRRIRSDRARAAVLPAIVGLLPMPGGAVVSAPMVEECAVGTREEQHFTNYWFRHIWEIWWPLYPPVLLAAKMADVPLISFSLMLAPLMLCMAAVGVIWILRRLPATTEEWAGAGSMTSVMGAIAIMLAGVPVLGVMEPRVHMLPADWHVAFAVVPAVLFLVWRHGSAALWRTLATQRLWALVGMAASIKLFGAMVSGSGAAAEATEVATRCGAAWSAVLLLPLLAGVVTGNTVAAVTMSFPLVAALPLARSAGDDPRLLIFAVAYASSFAGYLLSPVHMCFVLSARFFGAETMCGLARMLVPVGAWSACAATWFVFWYFLNATA